MRLPALDAVLSHWSMLCEGLQTPTDAFYEGLKEALKRRQMPRIHIRQIEWMEGGVLSPNRVYLRVEGNDLRFDICAAPFGAGSFFSWWLTIRPAKLTALWLALYLVLTWVIYMALHATLVGYLAMESPSGIWGFVLRFLLESWVLLAPFSLLAAMVPISAFARGGFQEPERAILEVPLVGWIYGRIFAPLTYYKLDTAAMFRASIHEALLEVIDGLSTTQGLRALAPEDRKPTHDRLG